MTRDRKLERALVDPSTALICCDDLDEHGDDDEMQRPSQQESEMANLLRGHGDLSVVDVEGGVVVT